MSNFIVNFARWVSISCNKSKKEHKITALSKIKSAVVFVDPSKEDAAVAISNIKSFFEYSNIRITVFCPNEKELNLWGFLKHRVRVPRKSKRQEDLFINLVDTNNSFAARYEASCSPAIFKVGINTTPERLYDIIVIPTENVSISQSSLFAYIKDCLTIIQ